MIYPRLEAAILFAVFILIMTVGTANGDSYHHHRSEVTIVEKTSQNASGTALALSCGSIEFSPSNADQFGAALGGYDGSVAPCIGGAFTSDKNRSLYSGRIGTESGKVGGSISGTWKF